MKTKTTVTPVTDAKGIELTAIKRAKWVGRAVVIQTAALRGCRAKVVAQSHRTAALTVELTENFGAYRRGQPVTLMPYEVQV